MPGTPLVAGWASVEAIGRSDAPVEIARSRRATRATATPPRRARSFRGALPFRRPMARRGALRARDTLLAGDAIDGPAIVASRTARPSSVGWRAQMTAQGNLVLTRTTPLPTRRSLGTDADPVRLEIFNNLFMSIAEQMGLRLQNTAYSVNIKERLDSRARSSTATAT